ncbi:MAG: hypothetical protein ACMXYG_05720 [Candidatus Woesearchaeota archaeon]
MKKISLLIALLAVLCISFALAITDVSQVTIGSATQEASNFNDARFGIYQTTILNFNTNNTIEIDSINPVAPFSNKPSVLEINNLNLSIVGRSTGTIVLSGRIPESLDAVDSSGVPKPFKVADVTFIDTVDSSTATVTVYMQRRNRLEFERVTLTHGDSQERVTNGRRISSMKIGDSGDFEFTIRNRYSTGADLRIEDIVLSIKEDGNKLDIDEEDKIGSIDANKRETEIVSFSIDRDADQGRHNVFLRVIGEDDYRAKHGEQYTVIFDIRKERDDLSIIRLDLNPDSILLCEDRQSTLTVGIRNIGLNRQRNAEIIVENEALKYYNTITNIDLFDGETLANRFPIIIPSMARAGAYRFNIIIRNDRGTITDQQTATLFVRSCLDEPIEKPNDSTTIPRNVEVIGPEDSGLTIAQPIPSQPSLGTDTAKDDSVDMFFILYIGLILVLLLGIVLLLYILFKN